MKYNMISTTHIGKGHKENEKPNQDAVVANRIKTSEGDIYIVGCFDGVSACKYADKASAFLAENITHIIKQKVTDRKDFNLEILKNSIEELHTKYIEMIPEDSSLSEYGTTLELGVLHNDKAYMVHAGDGLIAILHNDGIIEVSDTEKHNDRYGSVYPFDSKTKWEFRECDHVAGLLVCTDGVYDEIVPTPIRRSNYSFDTSLLLPIFDVRGHKSFRSQKRYIDSYISGQLNEDAIKTSCERLVKKKIMTGVELEDLEMIKKSRVYKFAKSEDDLSLALVVNRSRLPKKYNCQNAIPDYYAIWLKEQEKLRNISFARN